MAQEDSSEGKGAIRRALWAILVVVLVLAGMIFYLGRPLVNGRSILLATLPVDPFDPLRGQYIIIRYEIGDVQAPANVQLGESLYVWLHADEKGISKAVSAERYPPEDRNFIRGTVSQIYGNRAKMEYGIEQYFFERAANVPITDVVVHAMVDDSGQARIANLLKDGKPLDIKYNTEALK